MVAMMAMDALPMENDARLDCADGCPAWDGGYQRKMVDGVMVCGGDDWCDSAFRQGLGSFPSGADDLLPMVVCYDKLFSDDVLAYSSVSVREEVPVLTLQIPTDKGVLLLTPVVDQDVRRIKDQLFSQDDRTDGISGLSLPICGLLIHRGAVGLDGQDLDHWRGVVWDPGIVCQQCWHVCSYCHVWAEWSFWTEIESGCCRTINWKLGYLGCIDPPCDVDRLCGCDDWRINEVVLVVTPGGSNDIRFDFEMVVCMFCTYCVFYLAYNNCSAYSVSVVRVFPGLPLCVGYIR